MRQATKTPAAIAGTLLRENGFSLSLAESCTGGLASSFVTDVSGSSDYFKGSVVAYDNEVKKDLLGVTPVILKEYGAVSSQCALSMASGVMGLFKTDASIAITGIAGPGGGTIRKPVGTVYVAVRVKDRTQVKKFLFKGTRRSIKKEAVEAALTLLSKALSIKKTLKGRGAGRPS